jgi:4-hydroxybenzoate polyprenyltransferase
VITAAADAGTASLLFYCTPGRTAAVVAAASLVYAGGAALNDAADAERDRALHPGRPVPSGAVGRRAAAAFGAALLAAGVGAAAFAGAASLGAYAGVAALAAAYDLLLKRWGPAGVLAMGLCRGGSVLAAALSSPAFADRLDGAPGRALLLPLPWLLQGAAVTAASLLEESPRGRALAPFAAAGVLLPTALVFALLPEPGAAGAGFAIAAAALLTFSLGRALVRPSGDRPGAAASAVVREGVFGFLLLDAAVLGVRGRWWESAGAIAVWIGLRLALAGRRS